MSSRPDRILRVAAEKRCHEFVRCFIAWRRAISYFNSVLIQDNMVTPISALATVCMAKAFVAAGAAREGDKSLK